jgi:hypothetical protein
LTFLIAGTMLLAMEAKSVGTASRILRFADFEIDLKAGRFGREA